ncbi:MAG TPA: GtrA family protein [Candidatus Limnocylindria bacterium]|nr:GtrA family protein [Candidatus Limnocylindria bacterium]
MAKKNHSKKLTTRLIEYLLTGGAWFWSGYILFAVLYSGLKWGIIPSKVISYLFGLTVNFLLERFWVFGDTHARKQLQKVTGRYVLLSGVNLGIDTAIVWSLSKVGITPYIGQFVSAGFFTIWNYVWYRLWVFAKKSKPGPKRPAAPALHRPKHVRHQVRKK